ncbi:MAG: hypothetical protein M3Y91_18760, partial [Actinomycetota bacterium]|nr:hypothetical protein [Actinomycetota bacterium]
RGPGALGGGVRHRPGSARGVGPTPGVPTPAANGSPPEAAITRVFRATGGPVTAVVTEKGAPVCEVDLLGPTGAVLARAWAGGQPVTLRAVAVADAALSLVLRPTGGSTLSWQADLNGTSG